MIFAVVIRLNLFAPDSAKFKIDTFSTIENKVKLKNSTTVKKVILQPRFHSRSPRVEQLVLTGKKNQTSTTTFAFLVRYSY